VLDGTVTVGAVPAVPAAERSAAGIAPIAFKGLPGGAVTVVDGPAPLPPEVVGVVVAEPDVVDGEELQAASPRAPARTMGSTSAPERRERRGMGPESSRSPQHRQGTPLT
jgi:hypothetical protein